MHRGNSGSSQPRYQHASTSSSSNASGPAPKQFPAVSSTSSAFSASANPDEDWTQITDLAERRRIQNRIAQRNYRKKLKKRLEDLERRAGSSSASPEQTHPELAAFGRDEDHNSLASRHRSRSDTTSHGDVGTEFLTQGYILPPDDRQMFSQHYTRQVSTSPPPFSYDQSSAASGFAGYGSAPPSFGAQSATIGNMPSYPPYASPQAFLPHQSDYMSSGQYVPSPPVKQDLYATDEMNPFGIGSASMAAGHAPGSVDTTAYHNPASTAYVSMKPHHQSYMPSQPPHAAHTRPPFAQSQSAPHLEDHRGRHPRPSMQPPYQ